MKTSTRTLETGGAGFVGSHLCERLLKNGYDVICADNYYTGRKANIAHLMGHSLFEMLRHDVASPLYVEVDEIFNLACPASPVHYQYNPVQTIKTAVLGAINTLGFWLAGLVRAFYKPLPLKCMAIPRCIPKQKIIGGVLIQ